MTHVPRWQRLVGMANCNHRLRPRLRPTRHPAGSVWSEWASARPLVFPDEGDAQGEQFALARGVVRKGAEPNHWVAIDTLCPIRQSRTTKGRSEPLGRN
jgi:hypothetical protein